MGDLKSLVLLQKAIPIVQIPLWFSVCLHCLLFWSMRKCKAIALAELLRSQITNFYFLIHIIA